MLLAVLGESANDFVANSQFSKCGIEMRHTRNEAFQLSSSWLPRAHEFDKSWPVKTKALH